VIQTVKVIQKDYYSVNYWETHLHLAILKDSG
jgi:hypothetical protein